MTHGYRLRVEDQGGAADILRRVGALAEIEQAVVAHCEKHTPKPPYRPQEIKALLAPSWRPEVRVPPFEPQYDNLPINDRYDLWKSFELDGGTQIGVAIEMERWEVWTDLLKFRRGIQRRQIAVGVILHDNPRTCTTSTIICGSSPSRFSARSRSCSQRRKARDWRRPPLRAVAALLPTGCPTIRMSDHRGLKDFLNLHRRLTHLGGQNDLPM